MKDSDVMTTNVVTVGAQTPLRRVAALLIERKISGLPVVEDGTVVGVVSEGDILAKERGPSTERSGWFGVLFEDRAVAELKLEARTAGTAMTSPALTITPERPVAEAAGVMVDEADSFYEKLTGKIGGERLRLGQLVFADASRWSRLYRRARRLMDVVMAGVIGLLSSPLMLLTALAIKLESRGPILYLQERVGLHNRTFRIIKFRSMRVDAEANGPVWANEADSRVTRVGRWIRKLRIDELPQLFNIIRGEMSLIGPRPERPVFIEQLEQQIPYYSERHLVKPGLTGWAQVRYRYGASLEDAREKHQYDLYYIKNQSPMLDALILLETARTVLFGRLSR